MKTNFHSRPGNNGMSSKHLKKIENRECKRKLTEFIKDNKTNVDLTFLIICNMAVRTNDCDMIKIIIRVLMTYAENSELGLDMIEHIKKDNPYNIHELITN